MLGWVDNTTKCHALKTSDIYVLPSHFVGFPNALLEAMASELCVVASSVGAVSDVIKDRINGLLFERGNVDQLAKKLQLAVSDSQLRMRCARAALQTVKTDYSVERAIVTFKNIL